MPFSKRTLIGIGIGVAGAAVIAIFMKRRIKPVVPLPSTPLLCRAQGCLFGQFIGDALGTRYEFELQSTVQQKIRADKGQRGLLPILGGGPFRLKPGQVTDDTELAMALARSLLQRKTYDQSAVAAAYKFWFDSGPFDVGRTTQNALQLPANIGHDVLSAMLKQSEDRNGASLSNGCLMRISPLAIAGTNWSIEDLTSCAKADARLTNPHLDAQIATATFAAAVAELIRSGDEKKAFEMAREIANESSLITDLLDAAEANAIPVKLSDGNEAESDTAHMGYLGIALQWAFAEMLHAESFETGLVRVISRGGDTDTNGCICGAMLGARFGVDAIPDEWRRTVTACRQKRVDTYPWVDSKDLQDVARQLVETVKTPDADQPKRNKKGML